MTITIKDAVENVEEFFETNLISYIAFPGTPLSSIDQSDCVLLDDLLFTMKNEYEKGEDGKKFKRVTLFLHSGGGILEAAIKFVNIIRQYANEYHVIVPMMAKSAATLMVLMADKQYFTTLSELGPVDPIIQSPTKPGLFVPATAIDNFIKYYAQTNEQRNSTNVNVNTPERLLLNKLEESFDPYLLGTYKTSLEFSKEEIQKALNKYSMKNANPYLIEQAVDEFTIKHSSHGYPIMYSELERFNIGEKISDEQLTVVKMLMAVYQNFMANSNIVKLTGNRDENKNVQITQVNPSQQIPTKTSL